MIEYLHSQYDRGNLPILEFYEIAQVSSEEVVQSCLVGLDDVCELQGCLSQLRAIEIIIAYARTPSLQIAVGRGLFITRTARLMRSFRRTSRNDSVSRWPDLTLALWCALLCDNSRIMDETLAIEAVDANIMSLVEWRSWFGDEYVLCAYPNLFAFWKTSLTNLTHILISLYKRFGSSHPRSALFGASLGRHTTEGFPSAGDDVSSHAAPEYQT